MMMSRQTTFRWTLFILSGFACFLIFFPFLMEILLAAFFAFALSPITKRLAAHKYFGRKGLAAVTMLALVLAIVVPIVLLGVSFFNLVNEFASADFQNSDFYQDLIRARDVVISTVRDLMERLHIQGRFNFVAMGNQFLSGVGTKIMAASAGIATRIPDFVLSLFIFCCTLYLFLAEGKKLRHLLTHNEFMPTRDLDKLIKIFQLSCYTTLVASVIVGLIQATTVAIGSLLLKAHHAVLIFLVTFIFSFIPVIGAAPVAFFLGFLALIKGDHLVAVGYLILGIIAGTMDNFIRPWLVRGEGNIHPVVMLIAIIGAIMLFGIPGLFLGPMFVSVAAQIYEIFFFGKSGKAPEEASAEEIMKRI